MPPLPLVRRTLHKLFADAPLVYVDCGARAGRLPDWLRALKDTIYVGFEADADECARLNASARRGHRYLAAFLAGSNGSRTFHVTRSAACSSLLQPDLAFLEQFSDLAPLFHVERELNVHTTTLADSLASAGITAPDFIELDTQGSELEILQGAGAILTGSVLGIQVEVEFAPMYLNQPLFADVDRFLRERGFHLLDVSKYHARRAAASAAIPTRGQLLWGHALYLRDAAQLGPQRAARAAVIAGMLDRPDLAAHLLRQAAESAPDTELRRRAAGAITVLTSPPQRHFPRSLVNWWRNRTVDATLDASVNRTTWRD